MNSNADSVYEAQVPGNILLCGEYAILEEGGLGIAMACLPKANAKAWKIDSPSSVIHTTTGMGRHSLNTATNIANPPFAIHIFRHLVEQMRRKGKEPPPLEIELDTRKFFDGEKKRGMGSSAAATVLLAGLIMASVYKPHELSHDSIAKAAVHAHRSAQGNRGSGYDVLTSCYGFTGLFTGGAHPLWQALPPAHPINQTRLFTFSGPREVNSKEAVGHYHEWRVKFPGQVSDFQRKSREYVKRLSDAKNKDDLMHWISELRILSEKLGSAIGVESWISPPAAISKKSVWKGSGAGNELGLLLMSTDCASIDNPEIRSLEICHSGLRLFSPEGSAIL